MSNSGQRRCSGEGRRTFVSSRSVSSRNHGSESREHVRWWGSFEPPRLHDRGDEPSPFHRAPDDDNAGLTTRTRALDAHRAETILVAGPVGAGAMRRVADLALLHHCELLAVMPTEVLAGHDPVIVWSGESPLVQLARIPRRRWEVQVKRAFDVVASALGLLVTTPIFALLAIAIRLESRGSVLFRHERIGRDGRKFQCLKLRTMGSDAEAVLRADPEMYEEYRRNHYKIPDSQDPRVTLWAGSCGGRASTNFRSSGTCSWATCRWWARGR